MGRLPLPVDYYCRYTLLCQCPALPTHEKKKKLVQHLLELFCFRASAQDHPDPNPDSITLAPTLLGYRGRQGQPRARLRCLFFQENARGRKAGLDQQTVKGLPRVPVAKSGVVNWRLS